MPGDLLHVQRIPEHSSDRPGAGRLGRHVRHDPRSLRYQVPARSTGTLKSVRHTRRIPVLDQGDLGSCTGNAAEGVLGTSPFLETLPGWFADVSGSAAEKQAVWLYSAATRLDDYDGEYPPTDTGSDGLSVAKAALAGGLISGYRHATSLDAALTALAARPVIAGINWYSSFDVPTDTGIVYITSGAQVRGGHEICLDELNVEDRLIGFTNSWGASWGEDGRAYLPWEDFERLLSEQGDVTAFVSLSQPAPTPTPDPGNGDLVGCLGSIIAAAQRGLDILKGKTS